MKYIILAKNDNHHDLYWANHRPANSFEFKDNAVGIGESHGLEKIVPNTNIDPILYLEIINQCWNCFQSTDLHHAMLGPDISQKEWIFYGGTFDPWHEGHQSCLDLLSRETGKQAFILADRNPHKELKKFSDLFEHWQQIAKNQRDPIAQVYPGFLLQNKNNPTISWVTQIHQKYSEQSISLLIGSDSFRNFLSWTNASDLILQLHAFYIVARKDREEELLEIKNRILKINSAITIKWLGHHPYEHLSSTNLRHK